MSANTALPPFLTGKGLPGLRALVSFGVLILLFNTQANGWLWLGLAGYFAVTVLFFARQRVSQRPQIFTGLLLDTLLITGLLYNYEGVLSGWVSILLIPAVVGGLALSRRRAWVIAISATLCYGFLVQQYLSGPMPHHHGSMAQHILGMLLTFCIAVALLTGFISHQAYRLRQQQTQLMQLQQQKLQEQRILALATLAANTTHQLGTPISSARLLLEEWQDSFSQQPQLSPALIAQAIAQLGRCESSLKSMVEQARRASSTEVHSQKVQQWLPPLLNNWWVGHNEIRLQQQLSDELANWYIAVTDNLNFALLNLLDNAATAVKGIDDPLISIDAQIVDAQLILTIQDNGKGLNQPSSDQDPLFYHHENIDFGQSGTGGLGIGIALAQSGFQQAGGHVTIDSNQKGTRLEIVLPVISVS